MYGCLINRRCRLSVLRPVPNAVSVSLPSPVGVNKPGRELTQGKGWDFPDKIFNQFHRRGFIIISNRHSFNALYTFDVDTDNFVIFTMVQKKVNESVNHVIYLHNIKKKKIESTLAF